MTQLYSISDKSYDFFFYGTLLVPAILCRVLGHRCDTLTFRDALLPNYTRHCVKHEDYPAVISREQTEQLRSGPIAPEDCNTRGTLVKGLTFADVRALEVFEGSQYRRKLLPVQVLSPPSTIKSLPKYLTDPSERAPIPEIPAQDIQTVEAWVYIWSHSLIGLDEAIWSFPSFLKDKSRAWTTESKEYEEVDQHHSQRNGNATNGLESLEGKSSKGYEDFGHGMLKYWGFAKDYVNLNHGSYGSTPLPVKEAMVKLAAEVEQSPDRFLRRTWLPLLRQVQSEVSELIGATPEEVVMVPNTTHGINNILTSIDWADGDVIVMYSTTYGAVAQTLKYLCDRNAKLSLEIVDVVFPCSHASIVEKTQAVLEKYNKATTDSAHAVGNTAGERVRMVVVDGIASMPGMIYPWEEVVGLCKKYGVLSLVDAAHMIGQVKVDVKKSEPDFWISNCHKWLMSGTIGYESARYPMGGRDWAFQRQVSGSLLSSSMVFSRILQYDWTGTNDWGPCMSVLDAIAFRKSIGGEERIMKYCHSLAVAGGKRVAKILGTDVIENEERNLTACMVNVNLPTCPDPKDDDEQRKQLTFFEDAHFEANCFSAVYRHDGKWIARFSAQVWNGLEDFEYIAKVLLKACEGIAQGKHLEAPKEASKLVLESGDEPLGDE
ncbi:hercynylcysteine S-oxide lyase, partial [Tremellales sp. Uapishka_1]